MVPLTQLAQQQIAIFFMFVSEAHTLQDKTVIYGQIITSGEFVFKSKYICSV